MLRGVSTVPLAFFYLFCWNINKFVYICRGKTTQAVMRQDYKPTAHVVRMTAEGTVLAERDIITPLECFIEGFALIWEKVAVYADKFDKVPTYKYTITPLNS